MRKAVWGGAGSTKSEAEDLYDVDSIAYLSDLETDTKIWWKTGDGKLYLLHPIQSHAIASIGTSSPRIDTTNLQSAIDQCRVIKDDYEIGLIRQANRVSADAHRAVLEKIKSFENESQVEGIFLDTCVSEGAHNQAYNIIAGSGSNASVLHYGKNDERLAGRQVLLIDAGAEWNCYASDVTRTFPISGQWTKEAKAIYDIVEKMQDTVISRLKPGVHYRDMQVLAHVIAANGLLELGILHNGTAAEILKAGTTLAFFPHGLGHHVGLEVHDVLNIRISMEDEQERRFIALDTSSLNFQLNHTDLEGKAVLTSASSLISNSSELYATLNDPGVCMSPAREDSPTLKEGMVITVEPGIYFSKFALENHFLKDPVHSKYINEEVLKKYMDVGGVRIEDDILITRNGYENLTTAPKGENALRIIRGEQEDPYFHHPPQSLAERNYKEHVYQEEMFNGYPNMDIAYPRYANYTEKEMEDANATWLAGYQTHITKTVRQKCEEHERIMLREQAMKRAVGVDISSPNGEQSAVSSSSWEACRGRHAAASAIEALDVKNTMAWHFPDHSNTPWMRQSVKRESDVVEINHPRRASEGADPQYKTISQKYEY